MSERQKMMAMMESSPGISVREWSRRWGVSRKTVYKWQKRLELEGMSGLADRSRRPHHSPGKTSSLLESRVVELRQANPGVSACKLRVMLVKAGEKNLPSSCTLNAILRRHGLIAPAASEARQHWQRFEKASPNEMWQMDFKGHVGMSGGGRCHPLTVLDDHSRYCVVLQSCGNEQSTTVQSALVSAYRKHGMPWKMLMDNGSPWGDEGKNPWTKLTVWMLRLGIRVSHGRPRHPQTQGKIERFHRSLKDELLRWREFADLSACAEAFAVWREKYNEERPHVALAYEVPSSRYQVSSRSYPEKLPTWEYASSDVVRKVSQGGEIKLKGRTWRIGKGFVGEQVAVRPSVKDGEKEVWYAGQWVGVLEEREVQATGMGGRTHEERGKSATVAALPPPTSPAPQCT
jgi:transposase InsO family protein